jgi:S-adenosylmethionine:tRNA ribosyltransferase-isomerase
MVTSELTYKLRPYQIATEPAEVRLGQRGFERMLTVNSSEAILSDETVWRLPELIEPGDIFVLNDSARLPGVLFCHTHNEGAQVELRIVRLNSDSEALARPFPSHFVRDSAVLELPDGNTLTVNEANIRPYGLCKITYAGGSLSEILTTHGYPITSFFYRDYFKLHHYNNFYAKEAKSVESPMAGLHLTPALIQRLRANGTVVASLTLHVSGSWLPLYADNSIVHHSYPEDYVIPQETAMAIQKARSQGKRVIACGSTVVKAIESAVDDGGRLTKLSGSSTLFLSPGYSFKVVNGYFTNFHPAASSLMLLDSAFVGKDVLLKAYEHASANNYLFYEFGDAVYYTR